MERNWRKRDENGESRERREMGWREMEKGKGWRAEKLYSVQSSM